MLARQHFFACVLLNHANFVRMNWWLLAAWLGATWTASARLATVGFSSGQVYRGHVRLTPQHVVLVNAAQDLWLQMPTTNLAWAVFEAPEPPRVAAAREAEPEAWQEQDIGPVRIRGDSLRVGASFTVRSSGLGVQGMSDSFHFICKAVGTNSEIVAHIAMVHQTHPSAGAGLMMREHLGADSRCVMVGVTPSRGGFFLFREMETGHALVQPQPGLAAPCWVKLKREGNEFTAYKSVNGCRWTLAGKTSVPMREDCYAGMATTSAREAVLNWTRFDKVREGPSLMNLEFPPRAELVSGSVVMGWPVSTGDGLLELRWNFSSVTVPMRQVARLIFQWASPDWLAAARRQSSGVWLANGEHLEGELRAVGDGRLRVSSVLYGLKSFDANNEVVMAALQPSSERPARFEVKTVNGSVWRAQALGFGENELILKESALGSVTIPLHELATIFPR